MAVFVDPGHRLANSAASCLARICHACNGSGRERLRVGGCPAYRLNRKTSASSPKFKPALHHRLIVRSETFANAAAFSTQAFGYFQIVPKAAKNLRQNLGHGLEYFHGVRGKRYRPTLVSSNCFFKKRCLIGGYQADQIPYRSDRSSRQYRIVTTIIIIF